MTSSDYIGSVSFTYCLRQVTTHRRSSTGYDLNSKCPWCLPGLDVLKSLAISKWTVSFVILMPLTVSAWTVWHRWPDNNATNTTVLCVMSLRLKTSDHLKTNLIKFTFMNGLDAIFEGFSYTSFQVHIKWQFFMYWNTTSLYIYCLSYFLLYRTTVIL